MIRQYNPQRFRTVNGRRIGTVPVGTIAYIQDSMRPFGSVEFPVCRNPWIVTAWHNREYFPCVQNRPEVQYMTGGHLATVRSLRDGRIKQVADWLLLRCEDAGLTRA